jgi:AcrR family transcriptional regulator
MPRVSEEHLDAQRKTILEAAVRCFAERGLHRSTMRDVIREAGVSAGALYLYFKSKEELILAIADSRHRRESQWIVDALDHDSFTESLHVLLGSFASQLTNPRTEQDRRLNVQLWAEAVLDPRINESVLSGIETPTNLLAKFFKAAQRQGRLPRRMNCRALSRVLVALYQGLLLQVAWEPGMSLTPHLGVIDSMLFGLAPTRGRADA